ncbi:hypothetical protein GCM10023187_39140 [Nibrella viscosa]|uniref:N-acetyltransferase domain-containing protein n=1 Tax=Nibrella viscosa TaxID=1084524 RepID=A0ABP8KP67_9BACT
MTSLQTETVDMTYERYEGNQFLENPFIRIRLHELVANSYQNADQLMHRIYSVNDIAFISRHEDKIVGIVLFSYGRRHQVLAGDRVYTAIYHGYAVTDQTYRNQGVLQNLMRIAADTFAKRLGRDTSQLLFYCVTSNPYAIRAYRKVSAYFEPFIDGSFTPAGARIVLQLKQQLGIGLKDSAHPFKFTTSLPQRYSQFERDTFSNAPIEEKKLIDTLNVLESQGDRVIFFWTPKSVGL